MYDQVTNYIEKRVKVPGKNVEECFKDLSVRTHKKGDYILKIGDFGDYYLFIVIYRGNSFVRKILNV